VGNGSFMTFNANLYDVEKY